METIEYIRAWMAEHPTAVNILRYLVWIVLIILVISFLRNPGQTKAAGYRDSL
jgi:hypothetical protein